MDICWEELYNSDLKKRFAETYPKGTQKTIYHVFLKTKEIEEILDKDLYNFSKNELENTLGSFRAKSVLSLKSKHSFIVKYIEFCIDNNLLQTGINLAKTITVLENFVDKRAMEEKYITEEELYGIVDEFCENAQDAVCFMLLWEGVKGEELYELRSLKVNDVDFNNRKITVTNEKGDKRTITVSNKTTAIIKEALGQKEYIKTNYDEVDLVSKTRKIIITDYVVRGSANSKDEILKYITIWQRINKIAKIYGNPYLTANNIYWSGIINMAKKIKGEKGKLTKEDYNKIAQKYGVEFKYEASYYEFVNKINNNID